MLNKIQYHFQNKLVWLLFKGVLYWREYVITLKTTQYHVLYHTTGQWTMSPKIDAASSNYELIQINFLFFSPKLCRKSWADVGIVAMLKNQVLIFTVFYQCKYKEVWFLKNSIATKVENFSFQRCASSYAFFFSQTSSSISLSP